MDEHDVKMKAKQSCALNTLYFIKKIMTLSLCSYVVFDCKNFVTHEEVSLENKLGNPDLQRSAEPLG